MRYAGTALLCVVAAFGAAFLVRRAVDHGTPGSRGTVAADTRTASSDPSPAGTGHTEDTVAVHHRTRGLAAEFAPGVQRITRKRPKPKNPAHHTVSHSSGSAPTDTTSTPAYTTSTPTYTPTATDSAPSNGSSGSGSGSGGAGSGTGTTSIGHSGKGSGTTTIG